MSYDTQCHARRGDTSAVLFTLVAAPRPVEWQRPAWDRFALDGAPILPDTLPDVALTWGYMPPALAQQLQTLLTVGVPVDLWLPTDGAPLAAPHQAHVPYAYVRGWLTPPSTTTSFDWANRGAQTWLLKGAAIVV